MKIKFIDKSKSSKEEEFFNKYRVLSSSTEWKINNKSNLTAGVSERDTSMLESLWNLYLTDETAFSIVQSISMITLGPRFSVEGIPEDSAEYDSLNRAFIRSWPSMYGVVRDSLIFGNSFSRIIHNRAGEFYNLEVLYPLDVEKSVDKNGEAHYEYNNKLYTSEDIYENYFFKRPDKIYAIPLLGPIKNALSRKHDMDASISTTLARHMPRFHIQCKPDQFNRYPTDDEREDIGLEFKKLSSSNEFVTTDLIGIDVIDTGSSIPDLASYQIYYLNSALMGSLVSPEIVGVQTSSGSYATAKTRMNAFLSFVIPFYQHSLEYSLKSQILENSKAIIKLNPPSELALPWSK